MCLFKCITRIVSENRLLVNVWTSPKTSWNLEKNTFILLFYHSEQNWVWKSSFSSDLRFYDCLLIRWLPTTSILVVIEGLYHYQFKSNDLKNHTVFSLFFLFFPFFWIYIKFPMFRKKNQLQRSNITEVVHSERCSYLNA